MWRPAAASQRLWLAALAVSTCGIALRIQQFALARSLWIDEAMLAYALATPDSSIIGELPYGQVAPPGFLLLVRIVVAVAGFGELTLRLPALLAGCAAVLASVLLARRVCGDVGALVTSLVIAFSPAAVYYSQEFKPYAFDLLLAALMPLLALRAWEARDSSRRWGALVAVATTGPLFSTSAVLIGLGVLLPPLAGSLFRREWREVRWHGVAVAGSVLGFLASFWVSYRYATNSDVMMQFWKGAYLDVGSTDALWRSAELLRRLGWGLLIGPPPRFVWWVTSPGVVVATFNGLALAFFSLMLVGSARLIKAQKGEVVVALWGPIFALAIVSLAQQYPLAARLGLFGLVPAVVLAATAFAGAREGTASSAMQAAGILLAGALVVLGFPPDLRWRLSDVQWSSAASLVDAAISARRPIYISARGIPQLLHYAIWEPSSGTFAKQQLLAMSQYGGAAYENSSECNGRGTVLPIGPRPHTSLIVGMPTGMTFEYMTGWSRLRPCPQWAAGEAARIQSVGSQVSLLFLHHIDNAAGALVSRLNAIGWECSTVAQNYTELLMHCGQRVGRGKPQSM